MRRREWLMGAMLACLFSAPRAGTNAAAALYVDLDCATAEIDSSASRAIGGSAPQPFWVGVRIADARYLDSYEFRIAFDPSKVAFVRAAAAVPEEGYANFLETRGGSAPLFIGKLSIRDSSRVSIGNSLGGSDSSKSPGGSGFLAYVEFRPLTAGEARFDLENAQLLDWSLEADAPAAVHGAALVLEPATRMRGRMASNPSARWIGRKLELDAGPREATLSIADAAGKVLYRRGGLLGRQSLSLPEIPERGYWVVLQSADGSLRLRFPSGG